MLTPLEALNRYSEGVPVDRNYLATYLKLNGGSSGSRTRLYTVTVYHTNRYTMNPTNLYTFIHV